MTHSTGDNSLSKSWPYEDISSWAMAAGIKYPVLLDMRVRQLLEGYLTSVGVEWGDRDCRLCLLIPLKLLLVWFPTGMRFLFSIRLWNTDTLTDGIPVVVTFQKDDCYDYHLRIELHENILFTMS
jgi:hypothetical protein